MVSYVKARLYNKSNGAFAGNGVLVKIIQENAISSFNFIAKEHQLVGIPFTTTSPQILVNNVRFEAEEGNVCSVRVAQGVVVDSFETILIGERLRGDSCLANFNVVLGDDIVNVTSDVFSINLDDIFVQEARQDAAVSGILIKTAYTQQYTYSGQSGYHANQRTTRFNTPLSNSKNYRMGIELELYAKNRQAFEKITGARTNWFQCETDSSLNQYSFPIEMKTIPLRPEDATSIDFWCSPMQKLKDLAFSAKYRRNDSDEGIPVTSTGLHVHISKEIFGSTEQERQKNLDKLIWFYTYYIEDIPQNHAKNVKICGREKGYGVLEGGPRTGYGDFSKKIGLSVVAKCNEAYQQVVAEMHQKVNDQRGDINIKRWESYGTIEFRKGKGSISCNRIAALCTWWEQMCLYCKETEPGDLSFEDFFARVNRFPAVARYFQPADDDA